MTPAEEIAVAANTLADAADDVNAYAEHWHSTIDLPYLPMPVRVFIRAMSPAVGRELADWLAEYEDFEFTEHGPLSDDLAAALRVARAINGGQP